MKVDLSLEVVLGDIELVGVDELLVRSGVAWLEGKVGVTGLAVL